MSGASLAETARAGVARPDAAASPGRLTAAWRLAAIGLAIFALAAGIRLAAIDTYVTIDESRWVQRASDFWAYIGQRDYEETFIIGHPGVTTMWTALVGLGQERARHFSFLEGKDDATRRDGYYEALIASRKPFAVVAALGVVAVTLLGWRLLGAGPAVVGGLLLAFEPFLVAHARVTHLDSGLTTYSAIAALSALVFFTAGGGWPYLALSGVAFGLAFLTKAPSVYLIGFVPLVAGISWLLGGRRVHALPRIAVILLVWGLLGGAVAMALWPAMRVDPVGTVLKMAQFTERVGGGEHDNYFAGRLTDDPGLLFYPLALLFRLAPATLVGVVLAGVLWRRLASSHRQTVLLALYSLGFMAMMTIGPKKFDRYLLPVFPMLGLLAGLGLWTLAQTLGRRGSNASAVPTIFGQGVLLVPALAILLQAGTLLWFFRYPLSYYNPLLGGGAVAERLILVGWGEGLDQVGAWIDAQPRPLGEPTVATSYHRVLQAQLQGSAIPLEHVRMADYVVPYVNTLQRGADADVLTPFLNGGPPEYAVRVNGIEYARVYRGPHAPATGEIGAELGGRLMLLRAVTAPGSGAVRSGEEVTVGLRWRGPGTAQDRALVAIMGADGRVVVQDERPVGGDGPDENGQPGDLHRLTLPARVPPGQYALTVRVTDARTRQALPVTAGPGQGESSIVLRSLTVERAP
mgnify:CR=1 FL=1